MPHQLLESLKIKPTVYLFADTDGLGLSLVEKLLSSFCKVVVITSKVDEWKIKSVLLKSNENFKIISLDEDIQETDLSYLIFIDNYLNRTNKEIVKAISINQKILGKKFVLFPYLVKSSDEKNLVNKIKFEFLKKESDIEFFYIGDLLGPNINLLSFIYSVINFHQQGITINGDNLIYPILAKDVVKTVYESLFSFGPEANEISLIGKAVNVSTLITYLTNHKIFSVNPEKYLEYKRVPCGSFVKNIFLINLVFAYKETIDWLIKNNSFTKVTKKSIAINKTTKPLKLPKITLDLKSSKSFKHKLNFMKDINVKRKSVFYSVFLSVFLLLFPLIIMLFSASFFILSLDSIGTGKKTLSIVLQNVSKNTSSLSKDTLNFYSNIPVLGYIYKGPQQISSIIYDANKLAQRGMDLFNIFDSFAPKILGNDLYSVSDITNEIFLELDALYKEVSFLTSEIEALDPTIKRNIYKYISKNEIDSVKDKVLVLRNVADYLDEILGAKEKKTYLLLFQNNMELRPTGGFIGSFALVTFDGGRMTEINIQDVYSADGQLKGHVEPPYQIKQYLGEAGWYLRDANWNPDFSISANKIEWFLEKEIDQKVDGVIAIDLEVVKQIIKVTGPINLTDYGKIINYENIYEVTQSEVEDNFFPGSRKKSSYLTALSKSLLNELVSNQNINNFKIGKLFLSGLEEKHIQLYFHNPKVQKEIVDANYSGGVITKNCIGNCFYNFVSYVDANVGVNKANYFLERSVRLNIFLNESKITNSLMITFKNNGNPLLGDKARYKSYIRALGLPGSKFEDIKITEFGQEKIVDPEIEINDNFKEAGTLIIVGPGEEKSVEFIWTNDLVNNLDFNNKGEFGTYLRKQAGTVNDKLSVNLFLPSFVNTTADQTFFTLTNYGSYVYNTLLTRDIFPLIYW